MTHSSEEDYSIDLYDINGRIILNKETDAINGRISISGLNSLENAFYFIKITNVTSGHSVTKKVIKN